ncbi:HNH endonuclease [Mycoplasma sp. 2045]|uniref:HNH endonuclease signature motif containing protein n=1 Tax=Mycoplasma sp. 2045 TaxID=2967301 RepID=UPI00211D0213|nr:HNH endonuclease signature motif containing protein [Mycoplasma sp. 2045]UUM20510.1 HNH endonuclease [Mycoplasma sp. 2045]
MKFKYIKLSDFIKMESSPFILGAFHSRTLTCEIDGKEYFYTYSNFKSSKFVNSIKFNLLDYLETLIDKLNKHSWYENWINFSSIKSKVDIRFYILNDIGLSYSLFYNMINNKIRSSKWITNFDSDETLLNEDQKDFMRGFVELRGSIDTKLKWLSQDYFYNNRVELKRSHIIVGMLNIPLCYINFNARDLQPQFVNNIQKRNTQFRINSFYYAKEIGFINDYKATIFEVVYDQHSKSIKDDIVYFDVELPKVNADVTFISRLNFFSNYIYKQQLTKELVEKFRKDLNFKTDVNDKKYRNWKIIDIFDDLAEDKCAICGTTSTYLKKNTNRQYFEIHHVISLSNDINNLDEIGNLVKLCPTCHRMLKKNSGKTEEQLKAIIKILHEHPEIYEFTSSYLQISDINELAEKIQSMLA